MTRTLGGARGWSVPVIRVVLAAVLLAPSVAGCAHRDGTDWIDEDVTFVADGLTLHGTYRHLSAGAPGAVALLISESGATDRNGDNNVAGPIGNMRQLVA